MSDKLGDVDYEDMDDLPLPKHIEYNHQQSEELSIPIPSPSKTTPRWVRPFSRIKLALGEPK